MRMHRTSRLALAAMFALLVAAACGGEAEETTTTTAAAEPATTTTEAMAETEYKVAVAYDLAGRGDGGFNDLAYNGAEQAAAELGLELTEVTAKAEDTDQDRTDRLRLLADSGHNPIVAVGFTYAGPVAEVAAEYPDIWFGIVDDGTVEAPNVAGLVFAEEEGSFLVGVVAALESETGHVGFIGGVNIPLIVKFEAGYIAGANAVNPDIEITSTYLSQPPDFSGFNDPAKGKEAAKGMFDSGADIVYAAAGGSGGGLFEAATEGGHLAIGVDADQYYTAAPEVRDVIMTSMLKNVNVATHTFVTQVVDGSVQAGVNLFDLEAGGVGYSTSGGLIDHIADDVKAYADRIIAGEIEVPATTG
ncbi:MAG: BMP family ABC transporter substrate-binding protein [bacterium]|nr:BMP family ABC transporter substrate-binding protein [bacterium]